MVTRRVAVCRWTHCNIGSQTACCPLATSDVEICNYVNSNSKYEISPKFVFSWAYSDQTVRPPPKLTHERHTLGMSARPRNDPHCPKLCCLSCSLITNTHRKYPIFSCFGPFGTCKIPCAEIRNFFTCVRMRTRIHVFYIKSGLNRCRINGRKSAMY